MSEGVKDVTLDGTLTQASLVHTCGLQQHGALPAPLCS